MMEINVIFSSKNEAVFIKEKIILLKFSLMNLEFLNSKSDRFNNTVRNAQPLEYAYK